MQCSTDEHLHTVLYCCILRHNVILLRTQIQCSISAYSDTVFLLHTRTQWSVTSYSHTMISTAAYSDTMFANAYTDTLFCHILRHNVLLLHTQTLFCCCCITQKQCSAVVLLRHNIVLLHTQTLFCCCIPSHIVLLHTQVQCSTTVYSDIMFYFCINTGAARY